MEARARRPTAENSWKISSTMQQYIHKKVAYSAKLAKGSFGTASAYKFFY